MSILRIFVYRRGTLHIVKKHRTHEYLQSGTVVGLGSIGVDIIGVLNGFRADDCPRS